MATAEWGKRQISKEHFGSSNLVNGLHSSLLVFDVVEQQLAPSWTEEKVPVTDCDMCQLYAVCGDVVNLKPLSRVLGVL